MRIDKGLAHFGISAISNIILIIIIPIRATLHMTKYIIYINLVLRAHTAKVHTRLCEKCCESGIKTLQI